MSKIIFKQGYAPISLPKNYLAKNIRIYLDGYVNKLFIFIPFENFRSIVLQL